jgi:endonuclease/exonuclease/phosphatase family metal-dependent hydrolase
MGADLMSTVTVATLNLFANMGRWEERFPLIIDQFAELQPDVIALQEVNLATDQGMVIARAVNERLGDAAAYTIFHLNRPGKSAASQAQAVMARLPVEAHEGLDYLLYDCVAQRLRLRLEGGEALDFYATHLYYPPPAVDIRLQQAKRLVEWSDTWTGAAATVLAGDFNAYEGEPTVAFMKSRFTSAHEAANGREPEKTWPTPVNTWDESPPGTLDYVFVSGAGVLEAGLAFDRPSPDDPTLYPSDHLGLMAKLEIA